LRFCPTSGFSTRFNHQGSMLAPIAFLLSQLERS
jgi:hypothetical protein